MCQNGVNTEFFWSSVSGVRTECEKIWTKESPYLETFDVVNVLLKSFQKIIKRDDDITDEKGFTAFVDRFCFINGSIEDKN